MGPETTLPQEKVQPALDSSHLKFGTWFSPSLMSLFHREAVLGGLTALMRIFLSLLLSHSLRFLPLFTRS